jgi:CRP-like cAMP-binding protein
MPSIEANSGDRSTSRHDTLSSLDSALLFAGLSTGTDLSSVSTNVLLSLVAETARPHAPQARVVAITQGQVIFDAGRPMRHVYFPDSGAISLVAPLSTGRMIEVGSIGREGMVGLSVALGSGVADFQAVGQLKGEATRIPSAVFLALLRESRPLRKVLLRYGDLFLAQAQQSAVCQASHRIEQRSACWLLVAHDRFGHDDLPITHDFLASMLGVRRAGVTIALGVLRHAGCIGHGRMVIRIADRSALERSSCDCYHLLRANLGRILATDAPATADERA